MYAVVRSGSKQYRVEPGQRVRVEKLAGSVGDAVELGEVLLIGGGDDSPRVGTPLVSGAKALGKIVDQGRSAKEMLFKAKRRKNYRRKQGHRQAYTEILVDRIEG